MNKLKDLQNKRLTREEAKQVLGGLVDQGGGGSGCPTGSHIYTCYYGTNWIMYCVDDSMQNPDCNHPVWGTGDGVPNLPVPNNPE